MKAGSRAAVLAGALPVLALGIETSRLAAAHASAALGGGTLWESAVQVGAAVSAGAAGISLAVNRRVVACGALLALTGPAILLAQLPTPYAGSALLFTTALAGGALAPFLAGSAALACPVAPLRRADWVLVALSLAVAGALQGLLPAAFFDPRAAGCFSCPANLAEVHADPWLYEALVPWVLVATAVSGCGLAARAGWRWLRAPRIVRLVNAPLALGGTATCLLAAAAAVHMLQLATPGIDAALRALWLAQCGLVTLMAAGVAASGLRARRLAGKVTGTVLAAVPDAESLRRTLAASIDDPDLALVFPRDDGTVVDADGQRVGKVDRHLAVVQVARADAAVAEIRYRENLAGASHQLVAAVRAAGLALEHLAGRARLRAELAELAASRQRIVDIGDAERRRLERDLHDGAQQRLIALQVLLEMAATAADPAMSATYTAARQQMGVALEELRDLAHGIYPAALSDEGLRVGLRTLAETSPVPLIIKAAGPRRHAAAVEAAAYRLVADTVHTAGQDSCRTAVTVSISDSDDVLGIQLTTAGLNREAGELIMTGAQDRVAALDGSITLATECGQTIIEAVIPCAS
jgi:signal transduction histidine kinase